MLGHAELKVFPRIAACTRTCVRTPPPTHTHEPTSLVQEVELMEERIKESKQWGKMTAEQQ
jgi:hypothetical protein